MDHGSNPDADNLDRRYAPPRARLPNAVPGRRRRWSLVKVLIITGIIGFLIGLLLPPVAVPRRSRARAATPTAIPLAPAP